MPALSPPGTVLRSLFHSPVVFVILLALCLRGIYFVQVSDTVLWQWERWNQSDMDTFLRVARQIRDGDLLVREPYRPLHEWHLHLGTAEDWNAWTNPHAFYHIGGYYYLLALLMKLTGGSLTAVKIIQMILGAMHAALLSVIGTRLMGPLAGLIVGILAASYGPLLVLEPALLREGIGIFLSTLSLYLVLRTSAPSSERSSPSVPAWLSAGLSLGVTALMKETGFLLFGAIWLWTIARSSRLAWPSKMLAPVMLLLGFTLGLSPFIARNLVLGEPPLGSSPNLAVTFMVANAADVPNSGVLFFEDAPSFKDILRQSRARLLPTVELTLSTYKDQPARLLSHVWLKFSALWSNFEAPDIFSYDFTRLYLPLLDMLPRFVCVWIPALAGVLLWGIIRYRAGPSSLAEGLPFPPDVFGLVLVIIGFQACFLVLPPIVMRYRIILVPFLILIAGWMLAQGVHWFWHRRWTALSLWVCLLLAVTVTWEMWPMHPILGRHNVRGNHFEIAAQIHVSDNDWSAARKEFDRGIAYFESSNQAERAMLLRRDRLLGFAEAGRVNEVLDDWQLLASLRPDDPVLAKVSEMRRAQLEEFERRSK